MLVELDQAGELLEHLAVRALAGERVLLARQGRPVLRLEPCAVPVGPRQPGCLAGHIQVAEDAFSPELDDRIADWQEQSPLFPEPASSRGQRE